MASASKPNIIMIMTDDVGTWNASARSASASGERCSS